MKKIIVAIFILVFTGSAQGENRRSDAEQIIPTIRVIGVDGVAKKPASIQDLLDQGQLPKIVGKAAKGKALDLSNLGLTSVEGIQNVPGIEEVWTLNLENNDITTLPKNAFETLGNLRMFFLGNNNISEVEIGAFAGLFQLSYVDMAGNPDAEKLLKNKEFQFLKDAQSVDINWKEDEPTAEPKKRSRLKRWFGRGGNNS